jgi:oxysterol-binding protein 1
MTLMKTIIGKDLSKYSLPVFLNEPLSILQKSAEFLCFADLFEEAVTEPCPFRRMVLVSTFVASTQWFVVNRTSKPFISMLGETFEVVTDKFQYFGENVSQQPPIIAFNARGKGWELNKNVCARMKFTGTQVNVTDERLAELKLQVDGKEEIYTFKSPMMVVGNLLLPNKRYMEGCGAIIIENKTLDIKCEMVFI